MRIAIIGAGGIGGYLAAKLIAAGNDVAIIARGAHLSAIRETGLTLVERGAAQTMRPAIATDVADEAGPADLVIFAVKGQDLEGAITLAGPMVGPDSLALPFLNGVDAPDMLMTAFGPDRTLVGIARVSATITAPGEVSVHSDFASFVIGDMGGRQDVPSVKTIRNLFGSADIKTDDSPDVRAALWYKFAMLSSFSAITAGSRKTIGELRDIPECRALYGDLVAETCTVGRAKGIALPEDTEARIVAFAETMQGELKASLAHDLEAGKPLEVDWLSGAVVRLARETGVPAPAHATVHALLAPWRSGC